MQATILSRHLTIVVSVTYAGPRSGEHEWTVDVHRSGRINCGYQHQPPRGYVPAGDIPADVRRAALDCWHAQDQHANPELVKELHQ